MDQVKKLFDAVKKSYDRGKSPLLEIGELTKVCLKRLKTNTRELDYKALGDKHYHVLADLHLSRPYRKDLFIIDEADFASAWVELLEARDDLHYKLSEASITKAVYTAVMSFAMCYDIWKNKSRKTPGTFFEVVLGSLLSNVLPNDCQRTKFISLTTPVAAVINSVGIFDETEDVVSDDSGNVSTDIVFKISEKTSLVIPAKTTTRERVVQPFAHQRILDSFFGEGVYISLLCCVSETQRDDDDIKVNDICVPNTIKLFQRHLAKMGGIFYLDPPKRYLSLNGENGLAVGTIGLLFASHLKIIFNSSNEQKL